MGRGASVRQKFHADDAEQILMSDTPICRQMKAGCILAYPARPVNWEIVGWSLKPGMQRIS
ncbi:MAG: hypothetical protein DID91_2727704714 [Candidatus Nitrotoga sp. MKT]|nr:MAG: hypothetical protein DID91_2727704714 [Candidatus Nitrotoga sp. MKT]